MKHNLPIIAWIAFFFILAQFIGLAVLYSYIDVSASKTSGKTQFREMELAGKPLERPEWDESSAFVWIACAVLAGTFVMLALIKYRIVWLFKVWFGLAVMTCLTISFSAFIQSTIAFLISAIIAVWKLFKPNWWIHTISELFMYSGLAVIFVPVINIFSAFLLLVIISIYDIYSVWWSGHMVSLARFQAGERMFAGLIMPYQDGRIKTHMPDSISSKAQINPSHKTPLKSARKSTVKSAQSSTAKSVPKSNETHIRTAILGGGDIAFPLLFAGAVLKQWGLAQASLIAVFATIALVCLFIRGEDGKFYPAMPFISAGCFVGLAAAYFI